MITNVNIAITCREVLAGIKPQSDVVFAGGIAIERLKTVGRAVDAGGVVLERKTTGGRVSSAVCVV